MPRHGGARLFTSAVSGHVRGSTMDTGQVPEDGTDRGDRHKVLMRRLWPFVDAAFRPDSPAPEVAAATEAQVCRDVADLAEASPDFESDLSALLCVTAVFDWLAKTRADDHDLMTTLGLYRAMDRLDPDFAPPSARELFEQLDPDAELYGLLGTSVLSAALRCADQGLIDGGVRLMRRALAHLPADDPGRAALLGSLAAAAHATDQFAGTGESLAAFVDAARDFATAAEAAEATEVGSPLRDSAADMLTDGLSRLVVQATGRSSLRNAVATVKSVMATPPSGSAGYVKLCLQVSAALTVQGVQFADGPALREASRLALLALHQRALALTYAEPLLGIAGQSGSLLRALGDTLASCEQEPSAAALVSALQERLNGYRQTRDPALVLDDRAIMESTELLAIAHSEAAEPVRVSLTRAAALAGDLHWARFRERRWGRTPDDDPASGASIVVIPHDGQEFTEILLRLPDDPAGAAEANAAVAHYALLPPGDDETVPPTIRTTSRMIRETADNMASLALRRSLDLLNEYDRSGDPDLARQALGKLARALCSPYTDPRQRDSLAHRLGDALLCLYGTDQDPDTLAASMAVLQKVAASPRISADYRAEVLATLARAAVASYEGGGGRRALEQATAWARESVALDPATVSGRSVLASALLNGGPDAIALDEAITLLRALASDPEDGAGPADLANLGVALRMRARQDRPGKGLAESISWTRKAISAFRPGDIRDEPAWFNLAEALAGLETPDAASERVGVLTSLLSRTPPRDRYWTRYMYALGAALVDAHHQFSGQLDIARLLADARAAIADSRDNPDDRVTALADLSTVVLEANVFEADDWDIDVLRAALGLARKAVEASATHIRARLTLGKALHDLAEATGDPAAMAEAGEHYRAALALARPEDRLYPMAQSAMGNYLLTQFENSGDSGILHEAAQISRRAYETTAISHPHYPQILNNYTNAAVILAEETTDASALSGLIEALRAALAAQHGNDEMADMLAGALAMAFQVASYRGVPGADLDDAVRMARETLVYAVSPIRHAKRLSTLGYMLREVHILRHEQGALDESVAVLREAMAIIEAYDVTYAGIMQNLAASLGRRGRQMGDISAHDEAISLLRAAERAAVGHPARRVILITLGSYLADDAATLPEGIGFLRQALEITPPGHHERNRYLTTASIALHTSFKLTGDMSQLDDAIGFGEQACAEPGHAAAIQSANLAQLADCYWERVKASHARDDVRRVVTLLGEAIRILPTDSAILPSRLDQLGTVLMDVAAASGDAQAVARAATLFRAVALADTADTGQRARSARAWGEAAAKVGDSSAAFEAFSLVVELLDQVAWRGLEGADQERLIGRFSGAARTAAAWALECGNAVRAVEMLEQGRGVLLSRALETRTPFDELAEVAPELADTLSQVLAELGRPPADLIAGVADMEVPRLARSRRDIRAIRQVEAASDRRIRLARERDGLLERIRALPGFAGFMRPPRFEDLRAAAADGPVVIVNVAALRCDALIITADDVQAVPLPGLTEAALARQVEIFTGCLVIMEGGRGDFDLSLAIRARQVVIETLEWLWDGFAVPVLEALGISAPPADLPRLWWCPTGDLCFLPLHAAGRYARDGASSQSLLDYVISSYTPTAGFLAGLVGQPDQSATDGHVRDASALLVAVPASASGDAALPAVARDVAAFTARFPNGRVLADDAATAEAVLGALGDYQIVHFACHAQQHVRDPSSGFISAYDAPVTIRELRRRTARDGQLALLMGCETARGGRRLADEVITMATALQLTGFRHTVATLWLVDDADATTVAQHIYGATSPGHSGTQPPAASAPRHDITMAHAVHDAVQQLRAEYPFAPNRWAGTIHLGP